MSKDLQKSILIGFYSKNKQKNPIKSFQRPQNDAQQHWLLSPHEKKLFFNYKWQNWHKMDNFQKNLDVLEFSDSYFSNSVKILLVCQVLKVSTVLNHILILPVYFLFYKTLCYKNWNFWLPHTVILIDFWILCF